LGLLQIMTAKAPYASARYVSGLRDIC
jgi:hypothetical protein